MMSKVTKIDKHTDFSTLLPALLKGSKITAMHHLDGIAVHMRHETLTEQQLKDIEKFLTRCNPINDNERRASIRGLTYLFGIGVKQDIAQAEKHFNQAIEKNSNFAPAYKFRALSKLLRLHRMEALTDYDQAIQLNPDDAEAYFDRSKVHFKSHNYAAVISDLSRAIKLNPNFIAAYYERGIQQEILNASAGRPVNDEGVVEDFAHVIALSQGHHPQIKNIINALRDSPSHKGRLYLAHFSETGLLPEKGQQEALYHYRYLAQKALANKQYYVLADIASMAKEHHWKRQWPQAYQYLEKWLQQAANDDPKLFKSAVEQ